MKISDLKPFDKIFDVKNIDTIVWYKYFCVHPVLKKYHILFDLHENPFKIYETDLQQILDKDIHSFDETYTYINKILLQKLEQNKSDLHRIKINNELLNK